MADPVNIIPSAGNRSSHNAPQKKRKRCEKCGLLIEEADEADHVCKTASPSGSSNQESNGTVVELGKNGGLNIYG